MKQKPKARVSRKRCAICGERIIGSWLAMKYGRLVGDWKDQLRDGFRECFRVLKPGGVLVFKWAESHVPLSEVLSLTTETPLFGNRTGKTGQTHWVLFWKPNNQGEPQPPTTGMADRKNV